MRAMTDALRPKNAPAGSGRADAVLGAAAAFWLLTALIALVATASLLMVLIARVSTVSPEYMITRKLKGTSGCPCCFCRACVPAGES